MSLAAVLHEGSSSVASIFEREKIDGSNGSIPPVLSLIGGAQRNIKNFLKRETEKTENSYALVQNRTMVSNCRGPAKACVHYIIVFSQVEHNLEFDFAFSHPQFNCSTVLCSIFGHHGSILTHTGAAMRDQTLPKDMTRI